MRRAFVAALALVIGCGPGEPAADTPAARGLTVSDLVGTWEGEVRAEGSDSPVAYVELLATPREDGWSFTVASAANPALSTTSPARVTSIGGDSVVVETDPFASVLREGEQVSTHSVYRLEGDRLVGVVHATYPQTGETTVLRAEAARRR